MKLQTAIGTHRHVVTVQNPSGAPVADGDGSFTQLYGYATPQLWYCAILPATARDLERLGAGTVISTATHILMGRYHQGMSVASRIVFNGRVFQATGVSDPEERHIETIVVAVELIGAGLVVDQLLGQVGLFQDGLAQEGFV